MTSLARKALGAFYTPPFYAEKARELLKTAIARVPEGFDYVIIDRCAGTGNLEDGLPEDILAHCILSSRGPDECRALREKFAGRSRLLLPPQDALGEEFVSNPDIMRFVNDPRCAVIVYENPPFADTTSVEHQKLKAGKEASRWKESFAAREMRMALSAAKRPKIEGKAANELASAFIWSAFEYYLKKPCDSLAVFSPPKYWKAHHLIKKRLVAGFACNRRWFDTKIGACILCALWANEEWDGEEISVPAYDWDPKEGRLVREPRDLAIRKIRSLFSEAYYDRRPVERDPDGILCGFDGLPAKGAETPAAHSPDVLGYMVVKGANFDNPDLCVSLLRCAKTDGHGFFLRRDNYLEKLPMFAASRHVSRFRTWTERGRIMKSGDGADRFHTDIRSGKLADFLLKCLLFACLDPQNHMRSFRDAGGRLWLNELCLDAERRPTQAALDLSRMKINQSEGELLDLWEKLIRAARRDPRHNPAFAYGPYQIGAELANPETRALLKGLRAPLGEYYGKELMPALFEYELLK